MRSSPRYAPARIYEETAPLVSANLKRLNLVDWHGWVRSSIIPRWVDPALGRWEWQKWAYLDLAKAQVFVRERLEALGPDLAAAHFLCSRNCRVRFKGHDHWTEMDE